MHKNIIVGMQNANSRHDDIGDGRREDHELAVSTIIIKRYDYRLDCTFRHGFVKQFLLQSGNHQTSQHHC